RHFRDFRRRRYADWRYRSVPRTFRSPRPFSQTTSRGHRHITTMEAYAMIVAHNGGGDRTERNVGLVVLNRLSVVANLNHRDLLRVSPQPHKRSESRFLTKTGPCQGTFSPAVGASPPRTFDDATDLGRYRHLPTRRFPRPNGSR